MDDILLIQFLKKKGIISDNDIHEFHELTSPGLQEEPVYLNSYENHEKSITPEEAKKIVSEMCHIEGGRKYIGEKYGITKATEIYNKYKDIMSSNVTVCDVYIAINKQYHCYISLFKTWFTENIDCKIIESAIVFWFLDSSSKNINKVHEYIIN